MIQTEGYNCKNDQARIQDIFFVRLIINGNAEGLRARNQSAFSLTPKKKTRTELRQF